MRCHTTVRRAVAKGSGPRGTRSLSFPPPAISSPPNSVGGRLSHFLPAWQELCSDAWAIRTVREGLRLTFHDYPPLISNPIAFPLPRHRVHALRSAVSDLLSKAAIEVVPAPRDAGFYSRLFLVAKKSGGWRPVIDLSALNRYLVVDHFKMETPRSIIRALRPGEWATSVDLQDAYFHILVHRRFRRYLRFTLFGSVYQFRAMPFGLATAPRIFTRLLRLVIARVHAQSILMHIYFDDSLLHAATPHLVRHQTEWVLALFSNLGFCLSLTNRISSRHRIRYFSGIVSVSISVLSCLLGRNSSLFRFWYHPFYGSITFAYASSSVCWVY